MVVLRTVMMMVMMAHDGNTLIARKTRQVERDKDALYVSLLLNHGSHAMTMMMAMMTHSGSNDDDGDDNDGAGLLAAAAGAVDFFKLFEARQM
jgi:hypothetical protein